MIPFLIPLIPNLLGNTSDPGYAYALVYMGSVAFLLIIGIISHILLNNEQAKKLVVIMALIILFVVNPQTPFEIGIEGRIITIPPAIIDALLVLGFMAYVEFSRTLFLFRRYIDEYSGRQTPDTFHNFVVLAEVADRYTKFIIKRLGVAFLLILGFTGLYEAASIFGLLIDYRAVKVLPMLYIAAYAAFHAVKSSDRNHQDKIKESLLSRSS